MGVTGTQTPDYTSESDGSSNRPYSTESLCYSDSDGSCSGDRPSFSLEENFIVSTSSSRTKKARLRRSHDRGSSEDLFLTNTKRFIGLYEEHHSELQQIINRLYKKSEEFLDEVRKASKASWWWKIMAATGAGVFGVGAMLMSPLPTRTSLAVAAGVAVVGGLVGVAAGGDISITRDLIIQEVEKLLEESERAVKTFKTIADEVTSQLNLISTDVEKILNFQKGMIWRIIPGYGLRNLAKLFEAEDLWRLVVHIELTSSMAKNIYQFDALLPVPFEDSALLRDIDKLKKQFRIQENELESEAGWFVWKLKETTVHLQNTLDGMTWLKSEVEKLIIPELEYSAERENIQAPGACGFSHDMALPAQAFRDLKMDELEYMLPHPHPR